MSRNNTPTFIPPPTPPNSPSTPPPSPTQQPPTEQPQLPAPTHPQASTPEHSPSDDPHPPPEPTSREPHASSLTAENSAASSEMKKAYAMPAHKLSDLEKKEQRRRRKIESAKRSREKRRAEHEAVERRVVEINERIHFLEGEVNRLTSELLSGPRPSHARRESPRPDWFGAPF